MPRRQHRHDPRTLEKIRVPKGGGRRDRQDCHGGKGAMPVAKGRNSSAPITPPPSAAAPPAPGPAAADAPQRKGRVAIHRFAGGQRRGQEKADSAQHAAIARSWSRAAVHDCPIVPLRGPSYLDVNCRRIHYRLIPKNHVGIRRAAEADIFTGLAISLPGKIRYTISRLLKRKGARAMTYRQRRDSLPGWLWRPWPGSRTRLSARSARSWARATPYTELISSKALCYHDKKTFSLLTQFPGEHPGAVQIFGSDPACMAEAAQIAMEAHRRGYSWTSTWAAPWRRSSTTATARR